MKSWMIRFAIALNSKHWKHIRNKKQSLTQSIIYKIQIQIQYTVNYKHHFFMQHAVKHGRFDSFISCWCQPNSIDVASCYKKFSSGMQTSHSSWMDAVASSASLRHVVWMLSFWTSELVAPQSPPGTGMGADRLTWPDWLMIDDLSSMSNQNQFINSFTYSDFWFSGLWFWWISRVGNCKQLDLAGWTWQIYQDSDRTELH